MQTNLEEFPVSSFGRLTGLASINMEGCKGLTSLPEGLFSGLTSLTSIEMSGCDGLTSLPEGLFSGLTALEKMEIQGCDNLVLSDGLCKELKEIERRRAKAEADALFAEIDKDGDGFLSRAEVIAYITKQGGTEELANEQFDDLDIDKDGNLSKEEFLEAFCG